MTFEERLITALEEQKQLAAGRSSGYADRDLQWFIADALESFCGGLLRSLAASKTKEEAKP